MSALTEYFCAPLTRPASAWSVLNWWESRRATYNLSVGGAGLLSVAALTVFGALPPHPMPGMVPWQLIVTYGVLANVAYSFGPMVDLLIRRRWGDAYASVGPVLFRYGFVFSVGLTLLPIPAAALNWVARVAGVLA